MLRLHPDGDGEHATQACKCRVAPMQIGLQDDFRVAVSMKSRAFLFELLAQFDEVEDLAVVHDHGIAIGAEDGLVATCDIKDGEARRPKRYFFALETCLLIGTAMGDRVHGFGENAGRQSFAKVRKTGYATHLRSEEHTS